MSFRYRRSSSNKKEDWIIKEVSQSPRRTVPTISEPRKTPFRLCSAIAIIIFLGLVATVTFVIHISHKNVLPFSLLTKQEKFLQMNGFELQRDSKERKSKSQFRNEAVYIEDVVLLPDEVLAMVHLSSASSSALGQRSMVVCVYSDQVVTRVNGIEYLHGRAAVRCQLPEKKEKEDYKRYVKRLLSLSLLNRDLNRHIRQINRPSSDESILKWDFLVYESFSTSTDVVLFAKGVNHRQGVNTDPESLRCVYNGTVQTAVTVSSQEVFRCKHPNKAYRSELLGTRISLRWHGRLIPSVAYYQPPQDQHSEDDFSNREVLCSCTMVFNVTKFLKEWMMYHSHLGVGHFFLYDNNSEDNLEETVATLGGEFNVTRHPWPWVKTQEAGFSHCALLARNRCQWMVFADVDEFIFSPEWLNPVQEDIQFIEEANKTKSGSNLSQIGGKALKSLVMERSNIADSGSEAQIGQISINCNNFGASGLKVHPERGVTQGYTCREKAQHRHKSIVLLEALSPSLLNVIHHFQLKPGYTTDHLKSNEAVINHYKYQAWSEFKSKFRRRVSAYVVDWKEAKNAESQDRTPGLGKEAIEPPNWENRFCEVNDTSLRDFTLKVFSSGPKMLWQL